jgi:hypothetical protein
MVGDVAQEAALPSMHEALGSIQTHTHTHTHTHTQTHTQSMVTRV